MSNWHQNNYGDVVWEEYKPTVPVSGVWLRRRGSENDPSARVEMLVEVDGAWRVVASELLSGMFGVIAEPAGIWSAKVDEVTTDV